MESHPLPTRRTPTKHREREKGNINTRFELVAVGVVVVGGGGGGGLFNFITYIIPRYTFSHVLCWKIMLDLVR